MLVNRMAAASQCQRSRVAVIPILQKQGTDETDETYTEPRLFNSKSKIQNRELILRVGRWLRLGGARQRGLDAASGRLRAVPNASPDGAIALRQLR
ncbi:MAG: hypothetical protein ACTS3T_15780 [Almyronema sp.]